MKAIIVIDIQYGLTSRKSLYNELSFIETVNSAIINYRKYAYPIIFIQHNNKQLKAGTSDWEIDKRIDRKKGDIVLQKHHGNAFRSTKLKSMLDKKKIKEIVICGLVSHGCIKATCIGAADEGCVTYLLKNGHTNLNKNAASIINSTEKELQKIGVKTIMLTEQASDNHSPKDLHKMSAEELGELFPIIIEEHDENWRNYFEKERDLIFDSFGKDDIESIEHIGSTAIPNLKSKPTIDILFVVSDKIKNERIIKNLKSIGYQYIQRLENPPPYMMFVKGYSQQGFKGQTYHIHVRYKGDWDELYFRDYLLKNMQTAKEYEKLKLKLSMKYKYNRESYTNAKTDFIEKINKLAREEKS